MKQINGIELTLLVLFAFGVGNLTQELGHAAMTLLKGNRYSQAERDSFWLTDESNMVRTTIQKESGLEIKLVDTAYDYCLTRVADRFPKRDLFVGISDMCRSFVVLSALGLFPAARVALHDVNPTGRPVIVLSALIFLIAGIGWLSWKRMFRFRKLSEATVFRVYLAVEPQKDNRAARSNDDRAES